MKYILGAIFLGCIFDCFGYDYPKPINGYFSQRGQDKFLNELIFKGKRNGFFVEVGAHDGISFSNTYFFEKNLGWTGICVEPNPDIFQKLIQNRHCICEQLCIANHDKSMPFLKCSGYILEMYSGLLASYDSRFLDRIDKEIAQYGGSKQVISVPCIRFKDLFLKHNISHVDFLSLDIEGGEEAALKTIDFTQVQIDAIIVENNFNEDRIKSYLESQGYHRVERLGKDDIYVHKGGGVNV